MAFNLNFNELLNELKLIKFNEFYPSKLIQSTAGLYGLVDKYSGKFFWVLNFDFIRVVPRSFSK